MGSENLRESLIQTIRVIEKGIAMERHARQFYAVAARRTNSAEGRRMFEWLAQFEAGHKARLEARKKEILAGPELAGVDIPSLGDYGISETDETIMIPDDPSDIDILKIAIENEKRAYAFYQKKLTFATDSLVREMFEAMAGEEDRHITILSDQLEHIRINQRWQDMEELDRLIQSFEGE